MQVGNVTTPFGRRAMTLALVKGQLETADMRPGRAIDKWRLFRDVCEARERLGLQDRALAVLNALLTFYPETELSGETGLVVFPSNAQLSVRAHGIAGTTLRRHLAALVDAGLVQRRDSPNGKRYVHRNRAGDIEQAYGFDLAPLLARAGEIANLAQEVAEERRQFKRVREALTICRRDVRKLISAAMEEGAEGNWAAIEGMYVDLIARLPRHPSRLQTEAVLDEMGLLREEIINRLENQLKTQKTDVNDIQNGCHIQNSKPESINELEPRFETKQGKTGEPIAHPETVLGVNEEAATPDETPNSARRPVSGTVDFTKPAFPFGMVLRACPQIADYGAGGAISGWRDLMAAAVVVRSMLGVSPSAYQEACDIMGPENAATAIACILERAGQINSAGGYLRDLTRKAERGEFSLGPMLMALLRGASGGGAKTA